MLLYRFFRCHRHSALPFPVLQRSVLHLEPKMCFRADEINILTARIRLLQLHVGLSLYNCNFMKKSTLKTFAILLAQLSSW